MTLERVAHSIVCLRGRVLGPAKRAFIVNTCHPLLSASVCQEDYRGPHTHQNFLFTTPQIDRCPFDNEKIIPDIH